MIPRLRAEDESNEVIVTLVGMRKAVSDTLESYLGRLLCKYSVLD